MQQAFSDSSIRVQFAGHETFPLRLLWLKKVYDHAKDGVDVGTFQEQKAIATFGVGRNMAAAMRFWASASGLFEEKERIIAPTALGHDLLADDGFDAYLERAATIWLVHWNLASTPQLTTTIYYAFNQLTAAEFEPTALSADLLALAQAKGWRAAPITLKRDVEVFLRGYVRRADGGLDDAAEPLLAELGLVREARAGGWFEFVRGPKPSLHDAIFAYALGEFWERSGGATTLTAEQICYAPGSPGRVFKMDEDSVARRLIALDQLTDHAWIWTDTAGLRQIQKNRDVDIRALVARAYAPAAAPARKGKAA
jgi:hypothetical protein